MKAKFSPFAFTKYSSVLLGHSLFPAQLCVLYQPVKGMKMLSKVPVGNVEAEMLFIDCSTCCCADRKIIYA